MAKEQYVSNQEEIALKAKQWLNNNRPLTNEEMVMWIDDKYGASLVKGLSRTKYTAKVIVRGEDGEHEILVSLPRKQISQ